MAREIRVVFFGKVGCKLRPKRVDQDEREGGGPFRPRENFCAQNHAL